MSRAALVSVTPDTSTLVFAGERKQLVATAYDRQGAAITGKTFTWTVSDPRVASIDTEGNLMAKAPGRVTVTATADGVSGTATITVNPDLAGTRCAVCHGATPSHLTTPFPGTSCPACHLNGFTDPAASHYTSAEGHTAAARGFDLVGAHLVAPCYKCHDVATGVPRFTPASDVDCIACHRATFEAQHGTTPGWPTACIACHNRSSFRGGGGDHTVASGGFTLLGAHTQLACIKCHDAATWTPLFSPRSNTDCIACHQATFQTQHGATPGWPTACLVCHTTSTFQRGPFDHTTASDWFTLIGAHTQLACTKCHQPDTWGLRFSPQSNTDCIACHRTAYEAQHGGTPGWPTTCLSCHTTTSFKRAAFDHTTSSGGFTLVGAHTQLTCTKCHDAGTWTPLFTPQNNTDCIACHRANYQAQHSATPGWPTKCLLCHTTSSFLGVTFDHTNASAGFTLMGAHTQIACTKCHDAATWTPLFTPQNNTDCIACHRTAYQAQHGATPGWPTTCLLCHNWSTFTDASFDHDGEFFPIFSGEHAGRWNPTGCPTCHVQSADFTVFSCFGCHEHNQADMNEKHLWESGYTYDSKACLSCHLRP